MLILLFLVSCAGGQPAGNSNSIPFDKRLLIAVGDFQNKSGDTQYDDLLYTPSGSLIHELNQTACFRIIERERMQSLLDEYKLNMSGLVDPAKTQEVGQILGVDAILYTNLTAVHHEQSEDSVSTDKIMEKFEVKAGRGFNVKSVSEKYSITVDARLVLVKTGEIIATAKDMKEFENDYSEVGELVKSGKTMQTKELVKQTLDDSAKNIAFEISKQVKRNYYGN